VVIYFLQVYTYTLRDYSTKKYYLKFCVCILHTCVLFLLMLCPLPSIRHRLSNDDCLEDKREDYQNCSVLLYMTVVRIVIRTHMSSFLKFNIGLGLVFVGLRLTFGVFLCFSLDYFVRVLFALVAFDLVSSVLRQEISCEERFGTDLFCVELDIKPELSHSVSIRGVHLSLDIDIVQLL